MSNWSDLKASVAEVIKTNGNQEITGQILQNALNSIISNVGENATFAGIATPTTNPGTPDGNVFYLAIEPGVYSNFNGIKHQKDGNILIIYNNNSTWIARAVLDLSNLKNNIVPQYFLSEVAKEEVPITWIEGYYLKFDGTPEVSESWKYCEPFNIEKYKSKVGWDLYCTSSGVNPSFVAVCIYYDDNDNIIDEFIPNTYLVNCKLNIPKKAVKMALNAYNKAYNSIGEKMEPLKLVFAKTRPFQEMIDNFEIIKENAPQYCIDYREDINIEWIRGKYYNIAGTLSDNPNWEYCEPFSLDSFITNPYQESLFVTLEGRSDVVSSIVFFDDDNNVIKMLGVKGSSVNYKLIMPNRATKVAFSKPAIEYGTVSLGYKKTRFRLVKGIQIEIGDNYENINAFRQTPSYFTNPLGKRIINIEWIKDQYYDQYGNVQNQSPESKTCRCEPILVSSLNLGAFYDLYVSNLASSYKNISSIIFYDKFDNIIGIIKGNGFFNYRVPIPDKAYKIAFSGQYGTRVTGDNIVIRDTEVYVNKAISRKDYEEPMIIEALGDSLTAGSEWCDRLKGLLGQQVIGVNNRGIGGDTSIDLASRMGAIPFFISPVTIPESGSVNITLNSTLPLLQNKFAPGRQFNGDLRYGNYIIAGIEGTIKHTGGISIFDDNHVYTFTRVSPGDSVEIKNEIAVPKNYDSEYNKRIKIIWLGTNDVSSDVFNEDDLITNIRTIIGTTKRFIVLGLMCITIYENIKDLNYKLARAFGLHFLDIRHYMLNDALGDANIEPTEQDKSDIALGQVPKSLRIDDVHLNKVGYNLVGEQVYKRGKILKYWE